MGRGRQEEAVLESGREIAHGPRESGFYAVTPARRRRGMVCFVKDQHAAGKQRSQPLTHRISIGRVDQKVVRDKETAVGAPGIDAEPSLAAHSRHIGAIENLEDQPEALLQFSLPLFEH